MNTFLPLILFITFSASAQVNLFNIDPRAFVENKITLADIADDLVYIPLENTFPIGSILSYKILDKSIYICAKDVGVIRFDRNGKNPIQIGRFGRGPGEYSTFWSFAVDEKSGTIYVLDWRKIEVFSEKGNAIRTILLPECDKANCFTGIEFFNNNLLLAEFITNGQAKYDWIIKDINGTTIKEKNNSIPPFPSNYAALGGTYQYKNYINYWNYYNDTVFMILPDFSYKASMLFTTGSHRLPKQEIKSTSSKQYFSKLNNFFTPQYLFETSRFTWLVYRFEQKRALAIIDKLTKKSYLNYLSNDGTGGILNNIDGGVPFKTVSSLEENGNEYIIGHIDSYVLKSFITSNEFKNSKPNYPEKKLNLEKLANGLKETDNPILVLVKLKK